MYFKRNGAYFFAAGVAKVWHCAMACSFCRVVDAVSHTLFDMLRAREVAGQGSQPLGLSYPRIESTWRNV